MSERGKYIGERDKMEIKTREEELTSGELIIEKLCDFQVCAGKENEKEIDVYIY